MEQGVVEFFGFPLFPATLVLQFVSGPANAALCIVNARTGPGQEYRARCRLESVESSKPPLTRLT